MKIMSVYKDMNWIKIVVVLCWTSMLDGMSDELYQQPWFVYPWESIQKSLQKNQFPGPQLDELQKIKQNLPEWVTEQLINHCIKGFDADYCKKISQADLAERDFACQEHDLEPDQEELKQLFEMIEQSYNQIDHQYKREPFDIFLYRFKFQGNLPVWSVAISLITARNSDYKIFVTNRYCITQGPQILTTNQDSGCYAGFTFFLMAYVMLAGIAYYGESLSQ